MKVLALMLALAVGGVGLGCAHHTKHAVVEGLTQQEMSQTPDLGMLPDNGGIMVSYHFSRDLTEIEDYKMLRAVLNRIDLLNETDEKFDFDYNNKVVIFVYEGKTHVEATTADFERGEVELWTMWPSQDWYTMKTYKGNPLDILEYLIQGVEGNPTIEQGKASEELKRFTGRRTGCSLDRLPLRGKELL